MSTEIELETTVLLSSPANEEATTQHKIDTPEVYKAIAAGDIEFLKANTSQIGDFVSPAKNTIIHIYIISISTTEAYYREQWKAKFQIILKYLKAKWFKAVHLSPAETVRDMLKEWPSLLSKANGNGDTPLHMAARHGRYEIVKVLIDHVKENHGIAVEKEDVEAGKAGEKSHQSEVWKMLHETNADQETALHQALRYEHIEVAQVLIAEDDASFLYSVNKDGETPLYMAAERDNWLVGALILRKYKSQAYAGPDGRTALHAAALHRSTWFQKIDHICGRMNIGVIEAISSTKGLEFLTTKVDDDGRTPLHYNPELLLKLGNKSAILIADKDGNTALHIAASKGDYRGVGLFIKYHPECFDLVDKEGRNALHLAIKSGDKLTVETILENKLLSDLLKQKDNNGNTPLHLLATSPKIWCWPYAYALNDRRFDKMAFNTHKLTPHDEVLINKRTLSLVKTRRHDLYKAHIRPGRRAMTNSDTMEIKENGDGGQVNGRDEDNLKDERQSQLVAAALIATVTFAAGFTLPGGYIQDKGPHQGYAVLSSKNISFALFMISDSFGLVFSLAAVFIHLLIAMDAFKEKTTVRRLFDSALPLTLLAIGAMIIAFITGTYAVLVNSPWLAILVSVIGGFFFVLVGFLVEEARESVSFPIFGWVLGSLLMILLILPALTLLILVTLLALIAFIVWLIAYIVLSCVV